MNAERPARIIPRPARELAADTEALVRRDARPPRQQPDADSARPSLRRRALASLHRHVLDRLDAGPERASTARETPLSDLAVVGTNKTSGNDYRPTPRRLIRWVLNALPVVPREYAFVDLGSGRGRVVLEAARLPFRRIVGIEFAEALHEDALANLRHWPRARMACRDVDLINADAADAPLPDSDLVVWLRDPFNHRMMTRVAARLAEHGRRHRILIVLVDPSRAMAFRESAAFREIELPKTTRRRIALWSPCDVELFAAGDPDDPTES